MAVIAAMQALISNQGNRRYSEGWELQYADVAEQAVLFADAMLRQLDREV